MTNLDSSELYARLDKAGMRREIAGLPAQCQQAWNQAIELKLPPGYSDVNKVVIIGMGGSAIGGDLLKALALRLRSPQVIVQRDYGLPDFVDDKTLVIASSYSGNTEETLSGFEQALDMPCKKLVISSGGRLTAMAEENGLPFFIIRHVSPPRVALGYSLLPLMAIMQNLGFISGKSAEVEETVSLLEKLNKGWQDNVSQKENKAKQLALKLYKKITVVYGAEILSDVARRWKTQVNENSKAWAFFETLPELNHNAVLGYSHPVDMAAKMYVVMLRCPSIHHRTLLRYDITAELLGLKKIPYEIIDSQGSSDLAIMMSLVLLGDWVSFYLAMLYGIDPTPVPQIDLLKNRLAGEK